MEGGCPEDTVIAFEDHHGDIKGFCLSGDVIHVFHIVPSIKRYLLLKKGAEPATNDVRHSPALPHL